MPDGKWNDLNKSMFADLYNDPHINVLESRFKTLHSKLLCLVRKFHYSKKVNTIINLPLKEKWKYTLDDINFEENKRYILIFPDSVYPITTAYIKKIKDNFNVTCVLFLLNAVTENYMKYTEPYFPYLDYVFTFDYADAKKYGYIECAYLYSKFNINISKYSLNDIYYIGFDKGRFNVIQKIVDLSKNENIKSLVRVMGVSKKVYKENNSHNIICNQMITYIESLKEMLECNCILELLSTGQSGATLRYYEAVCYNKKLLTNNKNVVNLPFYNPDYIHVFENPEDIDWNWVKERIPVDYHYDGRFSPTHLIDKIIELEEEREKEENGKKQDN